MSTTKKILYTALLTIGFVLFSTLPVSLPSSISPVAHADIPAGCPGGGAGPKAPGVRCPALYNSKSAAQSHCSSTQHPAKASHGKWYCQDNPNTGFGQRTSTTCGGTNYHYYTPSIDIGCRGQGNPIMDALFGFIQFLSYGVGLVVVGSIIVGGIQYSASRGDPQATAMAINRIRSSLIALIIYIFGYAFLNYLLPGFVL